MSENEVLLPKELPSTKNLRLWEYVTDSDVAVISFSGLAKDLESLPNYEFGVSASGAGKYSALYIADQNCCWLNAEGMVDEIVGYIEEFVARVGAKRVVAIGNSMGGFMAMVMPYFTKIDTVFAAVPQYSIDPKVIKERRWKTWRSRIDKIRISSVGDYYVDTTNYVMIHGELADQKHVELFAGQSNVSRYIIPNKHHGVVLRMRNKKILVPYISFIVEEEYDKAAQLIQKKFRAYPIGSGEVA